MLFTTTLTIALLGASTFAAPAPDVLTARAGLCGDDHIDRGVWHLYNNPWGAGKAKGYSCTNLNFLNGNSIGFTSDFNWERGSKGGVKAYPNAKQVHNTAIGSVELLSSTVDWDLQCKGNSVGASIVYDLFLNDGGKPLELMLWVAAPGEAHPISWTYNNQGQPTPAYSNLKFPNDNHVYDLYIGPNSGATVYSFVIHGTLQEHGGRWTKYWSGNLNSFIVWLKQNKKIGAGTTLESSSFGIEATHGQDCHFNVKKLVIEERKR